MSKRIPGFDNRRKKGDPVMPWFLRNIVKTRHCWGWMGTLNAHGYGVFALNGKQVLSHRWFYQQTHGVTLSPDQFCCHSCDNRTCVRPDHIFVGSHEDNMADMRSKDRWKPEMCGPKKKNSAETMLGKL